TPNETAPPALAMPRTVAPQRTTLPRAVMNLATASGKKADRSTAGTTRSLSLLAPPNDERRTCANVFAEARSGGVLSPARHSGCQIAASACRGVAAKRDVTESSAA